MIRRPTRSTRTDTLCPYTTLFRSGSLDVSVSTLSRLAKVLGLTNGGPLLLESFTLSGAVNGTREDLRFDQRLTALGGTLRASGRALLPPAGPQIDEIGRAHV